MKRIAGLLATVTLATGLVVAAPAAGADTVIDGPDVASYQHPGGVAINWVSVRKSGREFGIVKATEGTSYTNPWFAKDYAGIAAAAMVRGSYHFARPARPVGSSAVAQAKYYVAHLPNVNAVKTLPPTLDLETTGGLSRGELIVWAQDFLLAVRQLTGRTPMIYTYPYFWRTTLGDPAALSRYPLWWAGYSGAPDATAVLWQYTASATISGIRGAVDMSRLTGSSTAWPTLSDGSQRVSWPAQAPGAAQHVSVTATVHAAVVRWLPPDAGSAAVTGYDVRVVETGQSVSVGATATSATVGGLTPGSSYTLTVTPRNAVGDGPSVTTAPVTPLVATSLVTVASVSSVYIGDSVTYVATLKNADTGLPISGASLQFFTRPLGSTSWGFVGRFATDADGVVALVRSPTRSTQVRFYFPAQPGIASSATLTTTVVRSRITAALSRSLVSVGVPVVLRGAISPQFAGVTVVRQVYSAGVWKKVASTTTGTGGAYRFSVQPRGVSTTTMRTVVVANRGRGAGYSSPVTLRVR